GFAPDVVGRTIVSGQEPPAHPKATIDASSQERGDVPRAVKGRVAHVARCVDERTVQDSVLVQSLHQTGNLPVVVLVELSEGNPSARVALTRVGSLSRRSRRVSVR